MPDPSLAAKNGETFADIVEGANARFLRDLGQALPRVRGRIAVWRSLDTLAPLCLTPLSFPFLYLPSWISPPWSLRIDRGFHEDLVYSSLNAYSFVRVVDDVTDNDKPHQARKLLPICGYFHAGFHHVYCKYFPADSDFWPLFRRFWFAQADATAEDSSLASIDMDAFVNVSSRKTLGAMVPVAAAALRYGKAQALEQWVVFVQQLGQFHQMANDFFGWASDRIHDVPTMFRSRYESWRGEREEFPDWIAREGFDWGRRLMRGQMSLLFEQAHSLGSDEAAGWLVNRNRLLGEQLSEMQASVRWCQDWIQMRATKRRAVMRNLSSAGGSVG